jgi:hypothetical protein
LANLLETRPADGRLWLEYSRELTQENGFDGAASEALLRSFKYSAHEAWIVRVRTRFTLAIWKVLSPELQVLTQNEILKYSDNYQFLEFLAEFYTTHPLAKGALTSIMKNAPTKTQRDFLGLVNAETKAQLTNG